MSFACSHGRPPHPIQVALPLGRLLELLLIGRRVLFGGDFVLRSRVLQKCRCPTTEGNGGDILAVK